MEKFSFTSVRTIHHEPGSARCFFDIAKDHLWKCAETAHVMVITDPGIVELGLEKDMITNLKQSGIKVLLFDAVEADPLQTTILRAVEQAKAHKINAVVGFGGGSSMDVAKLVALLTVSDQKLENIYGVGLAKGSRLPLALVPTTAGTGSEVTAVAVVTTGAFEKKGVVSPLLLPDLALLDAELTLGLPASTTAMTGVDAMVHSIEAYTSKNANNNPVSRALARVSLKLLGTNICAAVFDGKNINTRSDMLLGAMLAGQAFSNSPVAAVHALAYPIGARFHVPHGLSNALVLSHVMRFNSSVCMEQYAKLASLVFPDIGNDMSAQETSDTFIERMSALVANLGLKTKLTEVGIRSKDLPKLTEDAMKQTRLLVNNPKAITYDDVYHIYNQAL